MTGQSQSWPAVLNNCPRKEFKAGQGGFVRERGHPTGTEQDHHTSSEIFQALSTTLGLDDAPW